MDHVNNAVYLDWLEEAVLAGSSEEGADVISRVPRRYRLEYAAAADPGMGLSDAVWIDADGTWSYRLVCVDGPELFRATIGRPGGAA
jgi:acyl-ACP thioesterase